MAGVLAEAFTEGRCALAGIKQSLRCVRKPCGGVAKAAFEGSVDDFVAANPGAEAQCYNRVKQCGHCRKVCAYTLATCNGCGADLASVAESRTPNVFMGFAHGIARAGFPLRASTRLETEDVLVFDDPLVLAGCHVCAIPTDVHVPTAAGLFADPARGAALMRRLEAAAWAAVEAQFLADDAWMAGVYGTPRPSDETLRRAVVAGLNAPPSQYQLHLQYLLPPLLPRQLQLYRAGNHFTKDRFLPLDWVLAALDALAAKGVAFDEDLDGAELIARVQAVEGLEGVDYEASWQRCYDGVAASQTALGRYAPELFAYAVRDEDMRVLDLASGAAATGVDANELANADKGALGGYDRDGAVYYSFPRAAPLPLLSEL